MPSLNDIGITFWVLVIFNAVIICLVFITSITGAIKKDYTYQKKFLKISKYGLLAFLAFFVLGIILAGLSGFGNL